MEENKLVSCVIPTFKRSDTLRRSINSVLGQTYGNIEVLVVDDNEEGSDESKQVKTIIETIDDARVHLVLQPKHINGAEARNAGIRAAKGEYVAFLDDDDEWLPQKIEKQVAILEKQNIDGVSCLYNEYRNGILFHSCPPYSGDSIHRKVFDRSVAVFTSTILLRKEALMQTGLFDNTLRRHQDLQLLLDFTKDHHMFVINEYLVKLHADSKINRPSYEYLKEIKNSFFNSVSSHFNLYSKREQREIMAAHYFELAFCALKEHRWITAIRQILRVGINLPAYRNLFKRMKNRRYIAVQ